REQFVGAGRTRAVDVGEADDEVVYAADRLLLGHDVPACVMSMRYFCMSQAPVGQRSAHSPQCRQTSSSFTITRPVFRSPETYSAWSACRAGARSRVRRSASVPFFVKVMQSTGQMSTQASHSMHCCVANTVCTSQLRQRCASFHAVFTSKPSSTSTLMLRSTWFTSRHGTLWRVSGATSLS